MYLKNIYEIGKNVIVFWHTFSSENEESNLLMVSLYWNPNNRILTIFPDFTNNNDAGYTLPISTVKDSCFEYRYWIENLSNESLELITDTVNVKQI